MHWNSLPSDPLNYRKIQIYREIPDPIEIQTYSQNRFDISQNTVAHFFKSFQVNFEPAQELCVYRLFFRCSANIFLILNRLIFTVPSTKADKLMFHSKLHYPIFHVRNAFLKIHSLLSVVSLVFPTGEHS